MGLKKHLLTLCFVSLLSLLMAGKSKLYHKDSRGSHRNCLCQCIPLQYVDRKGIMHGNCTSTYNGAQWCYVKHQQYSQCDDLSQSQLFRDRYWSHHACTTPEENSHTCRDSIVPLFFLSTRGPMQKYGGNSDERLNGIP
uniref:Uncharacterized protein n=1 Tax=Lepeophtheirus salmonis TaxID=72036 RepID=A0A0K2VGL7_LEPSM